MPEIEPVVVEPPVVEPPVVEPPVTVVPVVEPPVVEPPAETWANTAPDDWRAQLAGDDEARLNQLTRMSSVGQLVDNYFEAQDKIRSGQIEAASVPTEDSSEDEWAAFRETNNIPTTAEEYKVELGEGLVIGDDDQEVLNQVYPVAHALNLPTEAVSQLANALLEGQAQQFHKLEIQQESYRKEADSLVRDAWKGDYEVNKNLIGATILGSLPESVRDEFAHATLADGRKVFNSPEMLIAMAEWARVQNPSAVVVPNNANPMQAMETEIAEIEKRIGDDTWYKDTGAQKRYQDLITARDNLKKQG